MWFSNDDGLMNILGNNDSNIINFNNPSPFFSSANTLDLDLVDSESILQFRNLRLRNTINVPTQFNSIIRQQCSLSTIPVTR